MAYLPDGGRGCNGCRDFVRWSGIDIITSRARRERSTTKRPIEVVTMKSSFRAALLLTFAASAVGAQASSAAGSVVIERKVDPAALRVGDIATYQQAPGRAVYITHRIAAIDTTANPMLLTFKGDANRVADPMPVPITAVRGKVWFAVPYIGRLRQEFASGGLRTVALLLLSLIHISEPTRH